MSTDYQQFCRRILEENDRQLNKFGEQTHSREEWFAILSEEVGEIARAINDHNRIPIGNGCLEICSELVQVAAVAKLFFEAEYDAFTEAEAEERFGRSQSESNRH